MGMKETRKDSRFSSTWVLDLKKKKKKNGQKKKKVFVFAKFSFFLFVDFFVEENSKERKDLSFVKNNQFIRNISINISCDWICIVELSLIHYNFGFF